MLIFLILGISQSLITRYQVKDFFNTYTPIDFQIESGYATGLQLGKNGMFYQLLYQVGKNEKTITDQDILLIWVSGELGCSSQIAFYEQAGPFEITKSATDYTITRRASSWNEFSSILFIDSLLGAGFSYGENLISSTQEASKYFVEFMTEFLKVHTEFTTTQTYLTGTGYAGHFVPYFSKSLLDNQLSINYKGIIIGSGFSSLLQQISSTSSSLLVNGLIDNSQHQKNKAEEAKIQYLILQKQDQSAGQSLNEYYQDLEKTVHVDIQQDYIETDWFNFMKQYKDKFGLSSGTSICNSFVKQEMIADQSFDLSSTFVTLLTKGSILIYSGQMDYQINNAGIYNFITTLRSEEIESWKSEQKNIFKVNGKTAGNYKNQDKFTLCIIYNSGHDINIDQPLHVSQMIKHHLNGDIDWK